jgi:hypothetical protein
MAGKKLIKNRLKDLKTKSKPKRNRIELKHSTDISKLFHLDKPLYYSGFALTDNYDVILFSINNDFLEKNSLTNQFDEFNLNEDNLAVKYDNQNQLIPINTDEGFMFENIGIISKNQINWFTKHFPNCIFYPVTEWFGKSVNTLIIVLAEVYGKAVGVVKTH